MIPILMYHRVGQPAHKGTPHRGITVHPSDFKRQMVWMKRFGYRGVSMRDLTPYLKGDQQGKVFGITFDDGYRDVYTHAMPLLNELGFTATNYFVARQLDGGNVWDYDKGMPHTPLMSIPEMQQWSAAGHEVGSHTLDHVHLPMLSPDLAEYQIKQSKIELEEALGAEVSSFCYPYGDESFDIRDMVRRAGYLNATTTVRGLVRVSDDFYGLPRIGVARTTNLFRFFQKCLTRLEDRRRRD